MKLPFKGTFRITQNFGENPASYAKFGLKGHNGIDYACPTGTEILAAHDGKVVETTNDPSGYGLYVKIENEKEGSLYAHLKEFKVVVGQDVKAGALLGISDNTGNSTGPHLHFGYFTKPRDRANGYAGYIDPAPFFTTEPMATITQKDLDALRFRSDDSWNKLKEAEREIKDLNEEIKDLDSQLTEKNRLLKHEGDNVVELTVQLQGMNIKYDELVKDYNDLVEASSQNISIEVPRENTTADSGTSTTVSTNPVEAPSENTKPEKPINQAQFDLFTFFSNLWRELLKALKK